MIPTRVPRSIPYRSIVFGLVAVLSLPCAVAAQNGEPDEKEEEQVVVLNVHTETTTSSNNMAASMGALPLADIGGIKGGAMSLFMQGLEAMRDMGLPQDLVSTIGIEGMKAGLKLDEELGEGGGPKTETMDYVVYIRPEEFRLEAQGFTMLWRAGEMWYTDPRTGALTAIDLNVANSAAQDRIHHDGMIVTPMPGAQTKGVSGHLTRGYDYSYTIGVGAESQAAATVEVTGEAWIASRLPEREQIATFYQNFASAFGDQQSMMGGQTAGMARLAEIGVPLETTDTASVYMMTIDENGEPFPLRVRKTVSTTTVTNISTVPLSELQEEVEAEPPPVDLEEPPAETQVPGGQPPDEPEPCDCSCTAFEELQDLDEDDPDAMAKAMCAQKCMAKWVGCATP